MELLDYLRLLRRRIAYVLLALVAGLAGGFAVAHGKTPQYTSTLRLFASSSAMNASGLFDSISQVANSAPVVLAAASAAGAKGPVGVEAAPLGDASVIVITVTAAQADDASGVAAAYVTALPQAFKKLDPSTPVSLQKLEQTPAVASPLHKTRTVLIGGALGLVVGLMAALLRDALDRSLRDPEELAERLSVPLRGTIPADRVSTGIVTLSRPQSARAEAYRRLGSSLRLAPDTDYQVKTLLMTSAQTREGKSTASLNLAAAASGAGERVLVIDADLRRPSIHTVMHYESSPGLSDVLTHRATLEEAIILDDDPGFSLLLSGSPTANPVDMLRAPEFRQLLDDLKPNYDLIIVDGPAALGVADAEVMGAACDAVLIVSRLGSTPRGKSKAAVTVMQRGSSRVWGVLGTFAEDTDPLPKPLRRGRATNLAPHGGGRDDLQRGVVTRPAKTVEQPASEAPPAPEEPTDRPSAASGEVRDGGPAAHSATGLERLRQHAEAGEVGDEAVTANVPEREIPSHDVDAPVEQNPSESSGATDPSPLSEAPPEL